MGVGIDVDLEICTYTYVYVCMFGVPIEGGKEFKLQARGT